MCDAGHLTSDALCLEKQGRVDPSPSAESHEILVGPTLTKTDLRPTPAPSPKLGVFAGKCAVLRRSISESCLFFMAESLPGLFGNMRYKKHKKCDDILIFD